MSYGDSEAVFRQRAAKIGLSDDVCKAMTDEGIKAMAHLAFACNFSPGCQHEQPFLQLVKKLLKREPSTIETSCMGRLFNESYANVALDIRARTEQTDETPARRLAPAERADRLREQQKRLAGLTITGQYEPGDTVVDRCVAIYDSDRLQYVDWSSSVSREHELLTGTKKDASLSFDAGGALKLAKQTKVDPCATGIEIQVRYCLARRALAFDQANLIKYELMEAWNEKLMQYRLEEAPVGYARTSMRQLEQADPKRFCVLAERTRDGIKSTSAGRPLDKVFKECAESTEVFKAPRFWPCYNTSLAPPPQSLSREMQSLQETNFKGDPKGKGKGGGSAPFVRIPHELLELKCVAATPKNHRICFSYNYKKAMPVARSAVKVFMYALSRMSQSACGPGPPRDGLTRGPTWRRVRLSPKRV